MLTPQPPRYDEAEQLAPSGRYYAADVDIFWNANEVSGEVCDVKVVFASKAARRSRAFQADLLTYTRQWTFNLGNCLIGWMTAGGMSPEFVFGHHLALGFVSREQMRSAVAEFAGIEECGWAREFTRGLAYA
jgi:hypothetical protein